MKKIIIPAFIVLAVALMFMSMSSPKSNAQDGSSFSDAQKEEIGKIINDYLLENPDVIFKAAEKHRQNEDNAEQQAFSDKRKEHSEFLYNNEDSPSVGNPDADVVIVEFFDYNCGYCKKALNDVQNVLKEDDNVRFVFKEMPILSEASRTAARWALAAHKQDKYFDFHVALMKLSGAKNETSMTKLAEDLDLDVEKMKEDVKDPAIDAMIDKNLLVARELGIRGTPAFIIDDFLARGYMGLDGMKRVIADTRKNRS